VSEGDKERKTERWGDYTCPIDDVALSFTRSGRPPSNLVALDQIWLVSSLPLSSLPRREREQRGRPSWPLASLPHIEREGAVRVEEGMRKR